MTNTIEPTKQPRRRAARRHDFDHASPPSDDRTTRSAALAPNRHTVLVGDDPELVEPHAIQWKRSPFDARGIGLVIAVYVVATSAVVGIGLAIVEWWDPSSFGRADADINRTLEDLRTGWLTTVSEHMSHLSDTRTKIVLGIALIPFCLWLFRRWHEAAFLFGGLLLEVSIFGTSARIVGRERPPVEQLEESFTSSFPSGHIAAATTFYLGLCVVIWMRTRTTWARAVGVVVGVGATIAVIWGRMYMGMHYLTDAIAGVLIGLVVLATMYRVVMRTLPPDESSARHDALVAATKESATKGAS